jgi:4-amino-4-deoxy-L-arabinose transferase-like glycosyltransferase
MSGAAPGGGTQTADSTLVAYLEAHQGSATYLVATVGSQSADSLIIATGKPVMDIGGFNGSDPYPTLAQFEALVAAGKVKYVLVSGGGAGGPGGTSSSTASAIMTWVESHGTQVSSSEIGSSAGTLYVLS